MRKRIILVAIGLVVIAMTVLLAIYAWTTKGGFDQFTGASLDRPHVIAIVGGSVLTEEELGGALDRLELANDLARSDKEAEVLLVRMIDRLVLYEEARRLGYGATVEETMADSIEPTRRACAGPDGQPCRDDILASGLTDDEYWARLLPIYQANRSIGNLLHNEVDTSLPDKVDGTTPMDRYLVKVRARARIVWRDDEARRIYLGIR